MIAQSFTLERNPVRRAGSYFNPAPFARSARRYFRTPPDAHFTDLGLRPVTVIIRLGLGLP